MLDSISISQAKAIFKRDARSAISHEVQFAMSWLSVIVTVTVTFFISTLVPASKKFGTNGMTATYFSYLITNLAFVSLQSRTIQSFSQSIRDAQLQGTLEIILSTPIKMSVIVLGGGLWPFTMAFTTAAVMLGTGVLFGLNLSHTNPCTLLAFLFLTMTSLTPLGVISAAMTMVVKQSAPFEYFFNTATYLFAGVYLPLHSLPPALQCIGWCLPIAHALIGLRGAIQGLSLSSLMPEALWLMGATLILLPLSLWIFDRAVKRAKIDGTLNEF